MQPRTLSWTSLGVLLRTAVSRMLMINTMNLFCPRHLLSCSCVTWRNAKGGKKKRGGGGGGVVVSCKWKPVTIITATVKDTNVVKLGRSVGQGCALL